MTEQGASPGGSDRRTMETPLHLLREWKENERVGPWDRRVEQRRGPHVIRHDRHMRKCLATCVTYDPGGTVHDVGCPTEDPMRSGTDRRASSDVGARARIMEIVASGRLSVTDIAVIARAKFGIVDARDEVLSMLGRELELTKDYKVVVHGDTSLSDEAENARHREAALAAVGEREGATTSPSGGSEGDRIQWRGSNSREVKAWLGRWFGYDAGKFYFDMGVIVCARQGDVGRYGDWFVRAADGIVTVEEGALTPTKANEPEAPTPPREPREAAVAAVEEREGTRTTRERVAILVSEVCDGAGCDLHRPCNSCRNVATRVINAIADEIEAGDEFSSEFARRDVAELLREEATRG